MDLKQFLIVTGAMAIMNEMGDSNTVSGLSTFINNDLKVSFLVDMENMISNFGNVDNLANSIIELIKTELPIYVK